jgi:hypothetical protein
MPISKPKAALLEGSGMDNPSSAPVNCPVRARAALFKSGFL